MYLVAVPCMEAVLLVDVVGVARASFFVVVRASFSIVVCANFLIVQKLAFEFGSS
jgi:hypothetical protein